MINEIDLSRAALQDISKRLQDKKNALIDLEQQMDVVSRSLVSTTERQDSSLKLEQDFTHSSSRVERTRGSKSPNRPRAGDSRIWSPKSMKKMAMSQGIEANLPPQGALGSPRVRHGGAPDAAGSTVYGQKSCEGTVGVASASAPTEQAATAEQPITLSQDDYPKRKDCTEDTGVLNPSEKRKATSSPYNDDEVQISVTRRPIKTRIVDSVEGEGPNKMKAVFTEEELSSDEDKEDAEISPSSTDSISNRRVTRRTVRQSNVAADFSALAAAQEVQ